MQLVPPINKIEVISEKSLTKSLQSKEVKFLSQDASVACCCEVVIITKETKTNG